MEQPCGCPDVEDGQTGKELPCVEDGSQLALMHRYTILVVPCLPLYTQWPRIKLIAFEQYRPVIRRRRSRCCKKCLARDVIIPGAFGRAFNKSRHAAYLGPEYGRVILYEIGSRNCMRSHISCCRLLQISVGTFYSTCDERNAAIIDFFLLIPEKYCITLLNVYF